MSRRIFFIVLAASAALTATQAAADRLTPGFAEPRNPPPPAAVPERAPRATFAPAWQAPPAEYMVSQGPWAARTDIVEVPGEIQTADGLVTVHPNLRHDPAWKVCQIDSRDLGRRNYRCTAYSYQPYGEGGYRPYGTYGRYAPAPVYWVAPGARIIWIDPRD